MADGTPIAVVLLSGGLDSAVALAAARASGFECVAVLFDYGQRHALELGAARRVAASQGVSRVTVIPVGLSAIGGSALTDPEIAVPKDRSQNERSEGVPVTYVPARNLIFLSLAAGLAETLGATDLFIGANAVDYSGYPGLPRAVPAGVRTGGDAGDIGRRGAWTGVHGARAADEPDEGADHPDGEGPACRLLVDVVVLRPGSGSDRRPRGDAGVRPVRFVHDQSPRVSRSGRGRSDAVRRRGRGAIERRQVR